MTLAHCKKIEVRESPIEGFGVFATDDIARGEILEEIPFVLFPRYHNLAKPIYDLLTNTGFVSSREKYHENLRQNLKFKEPEKYYFKWFPPVSLEGEQTTYTVLPLGFGPIYNTSNTDNNAGWQVKEKTFIFRAERDIKKDEEIRTFYGYFVGNDGAIFNCDQVFNLGIDTDNGRCVFKMARFGTVESFEAAKANPSFGRLAQLLAVSKNGLYLKRIAALIPTGEEKAAFDVPTDIPLTPLYAKVQEFRNSPFPLVRFTFEWENKENGLVQSEQIIFRK
jgi:hypothetical protein